jgi:hypothetical protein
VNGSSRCLGIAVLLGQHGGILLGDVPDGPAGLFQIFVRVGVIRPLPVNAH